jgi:metal-responsive CopG/Arc/MetJ family transcriptional regulator
VKNYDDETTPIGRITVSLRPALLAKLNRLKVRCSCSTSGIVEIALREFIGRDSEEQLAARLRAAGFGLRRRMSVK